MVSSPQAPLLASLAGCWPLGLRISPESVRIALVSSVSNRLAPVSNRIAPESSRIAPYRTVSRPDRLVSHRIAPSRIVSHRNRIVSLGSSRTGSSRAGIESSRAVASPKFSFAPVWKFSRFLHSLQAKVPYSFSNLTPVCVGVLLGLCSTPGPPWCSLWPSLIGGYHVAFAVLPAERNFLTTQSLEDHKLYFCTQVVNMVFTVGEEKCY